MNDKKINPIFLFILKYRKYNLIVTLISFILIIISVFFIMDKEYTAETTVLPSQIGNLSSLGGAINAIANISGLGDLGSNITSQETYEGIVYSRQLQNRLLNTIYKFKSNDQDYSGNLFQFLELDTEDSTELYEKAYKELKDVIYTDIDNDNNILTISVTLKYPELAAKVANRVVSILKDIISEKFSYEYQEQYTYIQNRIESVIDSIEHTEKNLKKYLEVNKMIVDAQSMIEEIQIRRAMTVQTEIYAELQKQKEIFILENMFRLSPIKVLDEAVTPYKKSRPKRILLSITLILLSAFVQVGFNASIVVYFDLKSRMKEIIK